MYEDVSDGDDDGRFELIDYTQASPWEKLIARVEDVLRSWSLQRSSETKLSSTVDFDEARRVSGWDGYVLKEDLPYGDLIYQLMYHFHATNPDDGGGVVPHDALDDLTDTSRDFPLHAHPIQRWYGLCNFVILSPQKDRATTESEADMLLSTLSVALDNCGCSTPVFVPVGPRWQGVYKGYALVGDISVRLATSIHLSIPQSVQSPQGLVDAFYHFASPHVTKGRNRKEKRRLLGLDSLTVAGRFTYVQEHWNDGGDWRAHARKRWASGSYWQKDMLWGCDLDPLEALHLSKTWPSIPVRRELLRDSGQALLLGQHIFPSDADPRWVLTCLYRHVPHCQGHYAIKAMFSALVEARRIGSVANMRIIAPREENIPTLTGRMLTDRIKARVSSSLGLPTASDIEEVMSAVFSSKNTSNPPHGDVKEQPTSDGKKPLRYQSPWKSGLKAAPPDSLMSSLSVYMMAVRGLRAYVLLWRGFALVCRAHWDGLELLPGVDHDGEIDYRHCLIYQKLQMLNHCIHTRRVWHAAHDGAPYPSWSSSSDGSECEGDEGGAEDKADDDWDHFEWSEEAEDGAEWDVDLHLSSGDEGDAPGRQHPQSPPHAAPGGAQASIIGHVRVRDVSSIDPPSDEEGAHGEAERQGVQAPLERDGQVLRLLTSGRVLYVPRTQSPVRRTEDVLAAEQAILRDLGTDQEAQRQRALMQSKQLSCDMQAFKAANPSSLLEDFVRWYSPRDWEEGDRDEVIRRLQSEQTESKEPINRSKGESSNSASIVDDGPSTQDDSDGWDVWDDDIDCDVDGDDDESIAKHSMGTSTSPALSTRVDGDASSSPATSSRTIATAFLLPMGRAGALSVRMRAPDNLWQQLWSAAKPIPAESQRPLMDVVTEAEKALHYLETISPSHLLAQLLCCSLSCIYHGLQDLECASSFPMLQSALNALWPVLQDVSELMTTPLLDASVELPTTSHALVKPLMDLLPRAETLFTRALSLLQKLPNQHRVVHELLSGKEPTLVTDEEKLTASYMVAQQSGKSEYHQSDSPDGWELRTTVRATRDADGIVVDADDVLDDAAHPEAREYIFRANCHRPWAGHSPPGPNRLYAMYTKTEFRTASAFSTSEGIMEMEG